MFLNLWSKPRQEDVVQDKIHVKSPGQLHWSVNHATSSTQNMKRKRDDSSSIRSQLDAPPLKQRIETMSHVEIPRHDVAPSPTFIQAAASVPSIPLEPFPRTNVNQQTIALNAQAERTASSRGDIVRKMASEYPPENPENSDTTPLRTGLDFAALRDAVESQFNLEILLKHKELQLIDQEIAKCQTGLEQLRRCNVIPYPATASNLSNMQAVSHGSGPVYHNTAPYAASWGITNGPYTRHYSRWLLQDPAFDDTLFDEPASATTIQGVGDRTTRAVRQERQSVAGKSRSSRGTTNARLTALPDGYPVAKEEKGPCIVTRSSDNKRVKLVCLDPSCRRSDFNSAQGFINHCRIQHQRAFASHDEAINQCGEEIDEDAGAGNNEGVVSQGTSSVGLVHPYVRLAFSPAGLSAPTPSAPSRSSKKRKASTLPTESPSSVGEAFLPATNRQSKMSPYVDVPDNIDGKKGPKQPLKPSLETPYLSRMVARLGKGGDLDDMVKQATTKTDIDFEQFSDEEELDDKEHEAISSEPMVKSHSTHGGMRPSAPSHVITSSTHQRPPSMDGASETPTVAEPSRRQARYSSPYNMRLEPSSSHADASMVDVNNLFNLSPNSTDPHPAPSLVSDDGDGDLENMHSDSESPSDMGDERDVQHEPQVMDHDGIDMGESSGLSMGHAKQHHHDEHHGPPSEIVAVTRRSRVASASTGASRTNDETNIGISSLSRAHRKGSKAKKPQ